MKFLSGLAFSVSLLLAGSAFAGSHTTWKSVDQQSSIAFGSIKKNTVGEVHHFTKVSGSVKDNGEMTITIDLNSVETNIAIRDKRIKRHIFQEGKASAVVTGKINMDDVKSLNTGETKLVTIDANLALAGVSSDLKAQMLVARLSENRVLVTTADFLMLSTKDLGIDGGVDMLKKLAKLDSITRVTPVSIRMVFQK